MARETRAAANAAAGSSISAFESGSGVTGAGGPKQDSPPNNKKRRRPTESEPNGDLISSIIENASPSTSTLPNSAPISGAGEQPRRLKVVLKMRKDDAKTNPPPGTDEVIQTSSTEEMVAGDVNEEVVEVDGDVSMEDVQGQELASEEDKEKDVKDRGKDNGRHGENRMSKEEKKGLLAVMEAMQVTLSSTTSHSTNPLIDIPLPHSRPPVPTASAVDKENKTSKKGRKGKGKEKALDVVVHPGEWTIRKALEGMEAVTIEDIETYLSELADVVSPNTPNPFRSGPSAIPSSSRAVPTPISDYFTALRSVLSSFAAREGNQRTPLPTVRWALHQRLPTHAYGLVDNQGTNQVIKDWFSSLIVSKEDLPEEKVEHKMTTSHRDTRSQKVDEDEQMGETADEMADDDGHVVTRLVKENQLGFADPVMVAPTDSLVSRLALPNNKLHVDMKAYNAVYDQQIGQTPSGPPVTLGQSLLKVHAGRKVASWRRRREKGRYVGWIGKAVTFPQSETSFTPSFAPTFDSSGASGGWGYESTLDALHTRASNRAWLASAWGVDIGRDWADLLEIEEAEECDAEAEVKEACREELEENTRRVLAFVAGTTETSAIDPSLLQTVIAIENPKTELQRKLDQNNKWMAELMAWQDIRVRRGQEEVLDEREKETATRVAQSLQELAALTVPGALVDSPPSSLPLKHHRPLAVALAETVISTAGPSVRGTLDPKRPRALMDNHTAQLKPNALMLARPQPPPMPAAPRPGINGNWPRPPIPGGYPMQGIPQMQAPPRPQYPPQMPGPYAGSPGYGQKVPYSPHPMYGPPPNGMYGNPNVYGSPTPRPPHGQPSPRNPLTAGTPRGIGAGMGLSLQSMSAPSQPGHLPPAQRGSGLRGELR